MACIRVLMRLFLVSMLCYVEGSCESTDPTGVPKFPILDHISFEAQRSLWLVLSPANVRNTYTGPIFRLRRGSDNATADFFADQEGNLSQGFHSAGTSLSKWLRLATPKGMDSGETASKVSVAYVLIWYDQSSFGNHAIQATYEFQPIFDTSRLVVKFKPGNYMVSNLDYPPALKFLENTIVVRHGEIRNIEGVLFGIRSSREGKNVWSLCRNSEGGYTGRSWNTDSNFGEYKRGNTIFETFNGEKFSYFINNKLAYNAQKIGASNDNLRASSMFAVLGDSILGQMLDGDMQFIFGASSVFNDKDRSILGITK